MTSVELNWILQGIQGKYAAAVVRRLHHAVGTACGVFQKMGRRVPGFRSRDIRQLIVRNHLVTYRLTGNEVRILKVAGGSQTMLESDFL